MAKYKIETLAYFFADHHSGGGYPHRGIDDSQFSMQQIVTQALANHVPWVISLGDAVNSARTHADAPIPLRNQLQQLVVGGVLVGYIDGNHDKRRTSWLASPDFVHLDHQPLELGKFVWMGLDFAPREEIQRQLTEDLPSEVTGLFMHQAWSDFINFEGVPQCAFADLPKQIVRLATGDYHGACVVEEHLGRAKQTVLVCNPGSTSMQDITEPGHKFFVAFMSDGTFQKLPLKTRPVLRWGINTTKELDAFLGEVRGRIDAVAGGGSVAGVPAELCRPLLHITYSAALRDVPRRVEKLVQDGAHLFWTEIKPDKVTGDFKARAAANQGKAFTAMQLLKDEIDPEGDAPHAKEAHALAEKLLHTRDKAEVLVTARRWLEEQLSRGE